jgi:hypothetical protein
MSAFGPKRTFLFAPHMSAFGGKADMTVCGNPLLRSLLGGKADMPFCTACVRLLPKADIAPHSILRGWFSVFLTHRPVAEC